MWLAGDALADDPAESFDLPAEPSHDDRRAFRLSFEGIVEGPVGLVLVAGERVDDPTVAVGPFSVYAV